MDSFEALENISQYLGKYRLRHIDILANEESNSNYTIFYEKLRDGKFKNEVEAEKFFYGDGKDANGKYKVFKARYKDKTFNTFIFLDSSNANFTDLQSAHIDIVREYSAISMIFARGLRIPALSYAERLFERALKFELSEIAFDLAKNIANTYATIYDKKNYYYFQKASFKLKKDIDVNFEVTNFYFELEFDLTDKILTKQEISKKVADFFENRKNLLLDHTNFNTQLISRLILLLRYTALNNYSEAEKVVDESIAFFKTKEFECIQPLTVFYNQKILCCIQLRKYEDAFKIFPEILQKHRIYNVTWFSSLKYFVQLCFHAKQYAEAHKYYALATNHTNFKIQEGLIKDNFAILKLYFIFLKRAKVFDFEPKDKDVVTKRKVTKVVNDISILNKEKDGLNISIYVVECLLNLTDKDSKSELSVESIDKYRYRYTPKKGVTARSHLFLKMLMILSKYPSNFKKGFDEANETLVELNNTVFDVFEQGIDKEIIPYANVWEALEILLVTEEI